MKKLLTILLLACANPVAANVLISDDFPTDGPLNGQTPAVGGTWTSISGTLDQIQVTDNSVFLTDANSEDIRSGFAPLSAGNVYFGFDLSVADPLTYTGVDFEYFSHFSESDTFNFTARTDIAAFSASGYRPGIATISGTAETVWLSDLAYDTVYRLVVGYDFNTGFASLWIDPTDVSSTSIASTTSVIAANIDGFNFRQSSASPDQALTIGGLRVATDFAAVVPEPSTYALLALSAAGLAGYAARRRRR
jgi:hypothetical protein